MPSSYNRDNYHLLFPPKPKFCYDLQAFVQDSTSNFTDLALTGQKIGDSGAMIIAQAFQRREELRQKEVTEGEDQEHQTEQEKDVEENDLVGRKLPKVSYKNPKINEGQRKKKKKKKKKKLVSLALGSNEIGWRGIQALMPQLQIHPTLTHLNLNGNLIDCTGAKYLASVVQENCTLQSLFLALNRIGNEGIQSIARALQANRQSRLQKINIEGNSITILPSELGQCQFLREFSYRGNPIEYTPRHVQRWLDHTIHNHQSIYQDGQNVHNHHIQQCIMDSFNLIMNHKPTFRTMKDLSPIILEDPILTVECKESLIQYAANKDSHGVLNMTFEEALLAVFSRISQNQHSIEIKKILNQDMADSLCKCFTGRMSRLINCLNGFDDLVTIHISENEQIGYIISQIRELLEGEENYTVEKHKEMVIKELEDRGYDITEELQEKWLKYIE